MNSFSWESGIGNPKGVHCRVADRLIEIVAEHDASVRITDREESVDCTSILEILSLALVYGSRVRFTAQGPDARKVAAAIDQLLSGQGSECET
ncbi:MAG: HPr family phosphocarrier protein [Candidatus Electrothrix sp. AR4]|nr:HPr family phosphocarrier protein [Candidatus Electrothrix sp. AR4]